MKRILVVDDVFGWRKYHKEIIESILEAPEVDLADSARAAYDLIIENNDEPYNIILTDMQMENDFEPLYAGEWLIHQIRTFKNYKNTKIVIISSAPNIKMIAENESVDYIRKSTAIDFPEAYDIINQ